MRILHFSDIHVDVPPQYIPLRDWLGKRLVGGANHLLRRGKHFRRTRSKLAALGRFAEEQGVDLAICTGDYTILGTDVELAAARELVAPLTTRPAGYVTVPGNHDVYLRDAVFERRFDKYFREFLVPERPDLAGPEGWPLVRFVSDDVVVVAFRSARPNPPVWRSSGRVDDAELRALEALLARPEVRERFVVLATHYALRRPDGQPDRPAHGLENAEEVLRAIADLPRACLLHGHIHQRFSLRLPGVGPTLLGGGSATHEGAEGFWLLDIDAGRAVATPGWFDGEHYQLDAAAVVELG